MEMLGNSLRKENESILKTSDKEFKSRALKDAEPSGSMNEK